MVCQQVFAHCIRVVAVRCTRAWHSFFVLQFSPHAPWTGRHAPARQRVCRLYRYIAAFTLPLDAERCAVERWTLNIVPHCANAFAEHLSRLLRGWNACRCHHAPVFLPGLDAIVEHSWFAVRERLLPFTWTHRQLLPFLLYQFGCLRLPYLVYRHTVVTGWTILRLEQILNNAFYCLSLFYGLPSYRYSVRAPGTFLANALVAGRLPTATAAGALPVLLVQNAYVVLVPLGFTPFTGAAATVTDALATRRVAYTPAHHDAFEPDTFNARCSFHLPDALPRLYMRCYALPLPAAAVRLPVAAHFGCACPSTARRLSALVHRVCCRVVMRCHFTLLDFGPVARTLHVQFAMQH